MATDNGLAGFAASFHQDVTARAESLAQPDFRASTFTRMMIDYLIDAGEVEDGEECHFRRRGMEVSGYNVSQDGESLDLFVSLHLDQPDPPTVAKAQAEPVLKRAVGFLTRAMDGLHRELEEASPEHDMAERIHGIAGRLRSARVFLLTDGQTRVTVKPWAVGDVSVTFHVWDIVRLYRCLSSGLQREPIEIDFQARFGGPVPCLESPRHDSDCRVFMALIPATMLHQIYEDHGPRLLELNVRTFLQARGKVNHGIRRTLLDRPERFLAYNNGISATAEEVRVVPLDGGGQGIAWVKNLQIVNGGQTTASIHHAVKRDGADVSRVMVQAKLSVVAPDSLAEVVPLISRYANSQNKVNEADFSANDPFHVRVQSLSRTVWAPARAGGQRQTRWFYERARGQYQDEKNRSGSAARARDFETVNPPGQRFSKTDLAKFENTWEQLPHVVSLGAQKNFQEFTLALAARGPVPEYTTEDFERLVAKAILFRRAEQVVGSRKFGGYRANIVTYTLAYLSHHTGKRIDLGRVWREQDITAALASAIEDLSVLVHQKLTSPPSGRKNVTEWCKRPECWDAVRAIEYPLPAALTRELLPGVEEDGGPTARPRAGRLARQPS